MNVSSNNRSSRRIVYNTQKKKWNTDYLVRLVIRLDIISKRIWPHCSETSLTPKAWHSSTNKCRSMWTETWQNLRNTFLENPYGFYFLQCFYRGCLALFIFGMISIAMAKGTWHLQPLYTFSGHDVCEYISSSKTYNVNMTLQPKQIIIICKNHLYVYECKPNHIKSLPDWVFYRFFSYASEMRIRLTVHQTWLLWT